MNVLPSFLMLGWGERIGWTLIHSTWQVAIIAAAYAVANFALRRRSSNARYLLGCAALVAMVVAPTLTFVRLPLPSPPSLPMPITEFAADFAPVDDIPLETTISLKVEMGMPLASAPLAAESSPDSLNIRAMIASWRYRLAPALPWLSTAWLVGVVFLAMRPLAGWITVSRLKRCGLAPLSTELRELAGRVMVRLGVYRAVQFAESQLVQVPTVVGYLRPMVLLPASAVTGLTTEQLELILAHELAHVRRHDYLVNLLQTVVEALLFYHPGMWWVSAQVRRERENCCDDVVVEACGNRTSYIRALWLVESRRNLAESAQVSSAAPALAATGGSLLARVRRLVLGRQGASPRESTTAWLAGLVVLGIVAVLILFGRPTAAESHFADPKQEVTAAGPQEPEIDAPDPQPVSRLSGSILYNGAPPEPELLGIPRTKRYWNGQEWVETGESPERRRYNDLGIPDESLIVGPEGGLANVVVWARSENMPFMWQGGLLPPSTIRADDGRFQPHVLAFWNAAPFTWINGMNESTNFRWKGQFNQRNKLVNSDQKYEFLVSKPERLPIRLDSNVHPWMSAYVLPLPHAYFAVTGRDGRFEIKNLPLGEWEFAMWHEKTGWLATDRFPTGRFNWTIRPGDNSLGDLRVDPVTLTEINSTAPAGPPPVPETPALDPLDEQGFSQLHRAAMGGHADRVVKLIEQGANVNVQQAKYHGTPLQYAAHRGHGETVQALLGHGADVNARDTNGRTPLVWAAMAGHADVMRRLLDARADVNAANAGGWTPLHYAVDRGHEEAAQLLIDRGADVQAANSQRKTPFDLNPHLNLRIPWQTLQKRSTPDTPSPSDDSSQTPRPRPPASLDSSKQPNQKILMSASPAPSDIVAVVRDKPILWRDVAPPAEWLEKRAEYERKHGHTMGYGLPEDYTMERLRGFIWGPLRDEYEKEHQLQPTEEEIDEFIKHRRKAELRRQQEAAADLEGRKQHLTEIRQQLDATGISPQTRKALEHELKVEQAQVARLEKRAETPQSKMDETQERFSAQWYLGNWKLQQSLYRKYGGRAIWQQVGPEAIDAMRDLLKEKQADGFFIIHNPSLHERFWEPYLRDHTGFLIRDPDRIFEHPWSSFEEAPPEASGPQ